MKGRILTTSLMLLAYLAVSACAGAGSGGKSSGGGGSTVSEVNGSIQTQTGDTAGFDSWIIVLMEKDTGISRVAEIDAIGNYSFKNVTGGVSFTMLLLEPDFAISSVLSMVSATVPNKVHQYFKLKDSTIPAIVHKGQNFEFTDPTGVTMQTDVASDTDGDGIPDGMEASLDEEDLTNEDEPGNSSLREFNLGQSSDIAAIDTDKDSVANGVDPDIDGDGLANWFDIDDDGNNSYDVFSVDANADGVLDTAQKVGDHYFGEELEYFAVQMFIEPLDSDNRVTMKLLAKVSKDVDITSVTIRGDSTLFDESQIIAKGSAGEEAGDIWNRAMLDDGESFDSSEKDGIYGRKVQLRTGQMPAGNQVMFIQLGFGSGTSQWFKEFPFTFTPLTPTALEFSYSDETVTLDSDSPFGDDSAGEAITNYLWSVTVYNSESTIVDNSAGIDGAETDYEIPSGKLEDGESYTGKVFVQSLAKISGFPVYVIESEEQDL